MRAVIQRVSKASVSIGGRVHGSIGDGLLVLLGVAEEDEAADVLWLSGKIVNLRIFGDEAGLMNRSLPDLIATGIDAGILLVSQFTLHASTKKGNRPSYIAAARPEKAVLLYESMISQLGNDLKKPVSTGVFGADMQVELLNDGPVTIWIDSKDRE